MYHTPKDLLFVAKMWQKSVLFAAHAKPNAFNTHQQKFIFPQQYGRARDEREEYHAGHDQHRHKLDLRQDELDHHEREKIHGATKKPTRGLEG